MTELLKIDNLIVSFRDRDEEGMTAVRGASLTIGPGETLALVGESGCGKTVLCKSMLGFLCARGHIDGGSIEYLGEDLAQLTEKDLVRYRGGEIAMVPQDPMTSLDPVVSVGDQIAEAIRIADRQKGGGEGPASARLTPNRPTPARPSGRLSRSEIRRRAVELMDRVGIADAENRYDQRPYQFSGGMRQRIVIAIALAGRPRLLLADEPTTALDEETQKEILQLIKRIQRLTGVGILFITHDLSLVEEMAGRVAIMKDGRLVEEGPVARVFSDPQHPYTRQLLGYLDYSKGRGHNHRGEVGASRPGGDSARPGTSLSGGDPARPGASRPGGDPARAGVSAEAAAPAETALSVRHLFKTYGSHHVLHDFSMEIKRGEIVGVIGPSGCGKSTLARCIMGIEPYEGGAVEVTAKSDRATEDHGTGAPAAGSKANSRSAGSKANTRPAGSPMQMIFQDSQEAFNSRMTIRSIIAEPLKIRRRMKKADIDARVDALMDEVGLDRSLAERRPWELSGGQRQRAAIARALIAEPTVIIADEPLTGLDVTAQAKIVHLFRRLVDERGLALLLIAHDRPMVQHVSDRIIEMDARQFNEPSS